ncbi:MAG: hypothetical protein K5764_03290 [Prevotella sp.]|nr:hypothetical protein [Prevotella sp.]
MKVSEQTLQQLERAIKKIADKYPSSSEPVMTDIHLRVNQETGELTAFDDDDREITRCVVEEWIDNKDDDFFEQIPSVVRQAIGNQKALAEGLAIFKPYSYVLEDEDKEPVEELYVCDDETVIIDPDLMEGLDKDLDDFIDKLLKD